MKIVALIGLSLLFASITWLIIERWLKPYVNKKALKHLSEALKEIDDETRKRYQKRSDYLRELTLLAFIGGWLEIFMYSFSIYIGRPEFVVLWIAIKTAARWDRKRDDKYEINNIEQRGIYYSYLIGNALTILFSYAAASIVNCKLIWFDV